MGNSICRMVVVALISAWALAAANSAKASYTSIVGTKAAYCLANWGYPLNPNWIVFEYFALSPQNCWASTLSGNISEYTTVEGHPIDRSIQGTSEYICQGDMFLEAVMSAAASRESSQLVAISGEYLFDFNFLGPECGSTEIALFQYTGDPEWFHGLVPETVYDLVTAGLISESDILFVHTEFPDLRPPVPPFTTPFSFDVPVGAISDDQIYLFSTVQTPLPEPSGTTVLLAGALGLCGLARIKAHRR